MRKAGDEINKANEIIRKLQSDIKNFKSKLKLKNVVTLQQEKLLDERHGTIESLQIEIEKSKETIQKLENAIEHEKQDNFKLSTAIEESKKVITDNNHGNHYLM